MAKRTACAFQVEDRLLHFLPSYQIGPEKGVVHLATAAILNAIWDLWAKQEGKVIPSPPHLGAATKPQVARCTSSHLKAEGPCTAGSPQDTQGIVGFPSYFSPSDVGSSQDIFGAA